MFAPAAMDRRRCLPLLALLALACGSWLLAAPADAQARDDDDADALIKQGIELRRAGRDVEALDQFRRANERAPSPRAQAQMGLADQALGRWPEAEDHITRALASPEDPWIVKNRPTLESAITAIGEHLGSLDILGEPAGAEILVQGQVAGKLPLGRPLRVTAGSVVLEVRAAGHLPLIRTLTVAAGQLSRESVTLPSVAGSTLASARPSGADLPSPPRAPADDGSAPAPAGRLRTLAWVALVAGAASAAVGATSVIIREVDARNYNTNCVDPAARLTMSQQGQCDDWRSGGSSASTVAVVTFIAAGALGAASAALFLTDRAQRTSERSVGLACVPDPAIVGLSCAARF